MKIKLTRYGHSIIIAMIGIGIFSFSNSILMGILGGATIGLALHIARTSCDE